MSRAAGKVRDTRDGVLRLRHIRPVARAGGIRGGECGLRLQAVTNGRTRSLCRASRSRGRGSSQWNRPERAGREWYAASVQLPGRRVRLQAVIGGRTRSLCCASRSRERESSQWNRPERAGRGWYVKRCAASVQLPGRRARFALQAVLNGRTRRLSVSRAAGKVRDTRDGVLRLRHIRPVARAGGIRGGECGLRLQAVTNGRTRSLIVRRAAGKENRRSGTARNAPGEGGTLHPSDCPGGEHGLRLQTVLNGRTRSLSVSRAAGKVRDTRDGVLRLRHIRPVVRADGIRGGECGLRLQTVIGGRTRSLCCASRSRGRESSQWNRPERAGRGWYAASVRLPGRGARLAASDRHWWTDAEPLPCVAQPGKRIIAVEPPGARRARVVRCIRPIARAASTASGRSQWTDAKPFRASRSRGKIRMGAGDTRDGDYVSGTSVQSPVRAESAAAASTACSFRPSSMDGRGAFPCATQSRKE